MATIKEDYVSFEIAKLLKEKGFDVPCNCYGAYNGVDLAYRFCLTNKYTNWNKHFDKTIISCPTLQMAMKWLKKAHNIVVEPFMQEDTKYVWYIHRIETKFNKKYLVFCWGSKNKKYEQYEEACEAAIKYCLKKLI